MPKVLFSGTNDRMIENVMALVPETYDKSRARATQAEFTRLLADFNPSLVIICLQNETKEMLRIYDSLCTKPEYTDIPVIAIGYEDDCEQFTGKLPIKSVKTFFMPLNRNDFLSAVTAYGAIAAKKAAEAEATEAKPKKSQTTPIAIPPMPTSMPETNPEDTMDFGDVLEELGLGTQTNKEKALVKQTQQLAGINGTKNILVVDDDVRMLNVIKLYLQDLYDVTVVPSGKLALKYISKKQADLILLDYMMPEMDGPEVLREIRTNSPCPNVPVVFLTGVADREMVLRGLEFLPAGYLLKPVTREVLLEKVTEVILGIK